MKIQSERCRICEKMVPKEEYKAHFADLHPAFKPYKCKICVTVGYFEPQQLNDHMVTKHAKMIAKTANFTGSVMANCFFFKLALRDRNVQVRFFLK